MHLIHRFAFTSVCRGACSGKSNSVTHCCHVQWVGSAVKLFTQWGRPQAEPAGLVLGNTCSSWPLQIRSLPNLAPSYRYWSLLSVTIKRLFQALLLLLFWGFCLKAEAHLLSLHASGSEGKCCVKEPSFLNEFPFCMFWVITKQS